MKVAVIGHGASVTGRGWGAAIDTMAAEGPLSERCAPSRAVVRMHNWEWQDPADYGVRCDYALVWGPWLWRDAPGIQRRPSEGFLAAALPPRILGRLSKRSDPPPYGRALLGLPVLQDTPAMYGFCRLLPKHCPTRGAAAIVLAHALLGAREIVMIGLDSIAEGTLTPYPEPYAQLIGAQHGESGSPGAETWHNYPAERDALKVWAAGAGVTLTVAGKDWP